MSACSRCAGHQDRYLPQLAPNPRVNSLWQMRKLKLVEKSLSKVVRLNLFFTGTSFKGPL